MRAQEMLSLRSWNRRILPSICVSSGTAGLMAEVPGLNVDPRALRRASGNARPPRLPWWHAFRWLESAGNLDAEVSVNGATLKPADVLNVAVAPSRIAKRIREVRRHA